MFITIIIVALGATFLEFCISVHIAHNLAPITKYEENQT